MFKFLHAADVHLDSPLGKLDRYEGAPAVEFRQATRRAFENLIDAAISEGVSFVVIAGDLYDGDWKDYNTGLYLVSQMARLRDAGISVFMVAGNHDAASRITKTLRLPENVSIFPWDRPTTHTLDKLKVALHGQSFASPSVKTDLSRGYPEATPGYYNIGLLHTCATGREGHESYAPCSLEGLNAKGYDYWALGHVHQREVIQAEPPVVFSGNTQGRHAHETGAKGCYLATVDDSGETGLEFRALDVVRWEVAEVDAAGAENGYEILDRFKRCLVILEDQHRSIPLAVRVHITGETSARDELLSDPEQWINEFRSAALEYGDGRVWVEKVKFDIRTPVSDLRPGPTPGALGELLKVFDELGSDSQSRRDLLAELDPVLKKLPRELKDGSGTIRLEDADWIDGLLDQVRPMLIKRLLRKEAGDENR